MHVEADDDFGRVGWLSSDLVVTRGNASYIDVMNETDTDLSGEPTQFTELNKVLDHLVRGAAECLGENLVAVYLQGSFALGEADEFSDVDFLTLTNTDVTEEEERALQDLHAKLYRLETPWAQHLEGSYAPKDRFRRVDPDRTPFLFLNNGASRLEPDIHCNSAVVRWILCEHGITLFGPTPKKRIDPVAAADLRTEAKQALREYVEWALEQTKTGGMSRWSQPYLVLTFCRILNTIESGRVASKHEAAEWACANLDPHWRPLIERAVADRPDPWARVHEPAANNLVEETLAFADYASLHADRLNTSAPSAN